MTHIPQINKGSEWRKWDLHVHTPFSIYQRFGNNDDTTWETYIKDLESLPEDFAVIGVNDYLFLEGYAKLKKEQTDNNRLPNLKLLPVVEFRIEKFAGINFEQLKRINLHVIFSDEVLLETIQSQFLNTLEQSYYLESGEPWTRAITPQSVEELGKQIKSSIPPAELHKYGSDLTEGFNNLNVKEEEIFRALNKDCFKGKYLIAIGKTEWGDLKWTDASIATKKSIINRAHIVFTASNSIVEFDKAKTQLTNQGVNDLLLDCSDAHYLSNQTDKDRIGNCYTWIKADPTFEGLKQILYEPNHRAKISEQKPREPIRKIESIKFNFLKETYIKRNNSNERQEFCLNQLRNEIFFSPYFTCLIGGRGTGKSTIINLLAERLGEKTDFFKENNLIIDGKKYDIETDTNNLVNVSGTNEIEFVSQGKIERLAEGNELTKLIFNERIKEVETGFYDLDAEINSLIIIIDETVKLLFDLQNISLSLKEKNKEKDTTQNIIDSVNDDRYKAITKRINEIRREINAINASQNRYENLLNSIRILLIENVKIETQNDIELRINEILNLIKSIDEVSINQENEVYIELNEFKASTERIDILTRDFVSENQKLKGFFLEKGMSEESIKDSQKANENLERTNSEIAQLTTKTDRIKELFKENSNKIECLSGLYNSYYQLIDTNLTQINRKLEVNNENVLNINFKFEFNTDFLKQIVFEEFYSTFSNFHISGTSQGQVREVLFLIEPNEDLLNYDYKTFLTKLENEIELKGYRRTNNYVKIVTDIFSSNINFIIYKLILRKHIYNLSKFIKIKGYYGDRELQNCSFGQRCTAVIVTLLMTGVKPLVIDEPEAHLDNRLVADYLVDLIKSKKLDRQIIFATHNSNFVINGDAELIHILDIPQNNIFTNLTSTSIENYDNREKLLKLEGGRDAFLTREQKYGIHN
ncbi:TrlF family AAA-like ATPase [Myroides sp. TSA_177.3]|uniref:TrlF family AAA-like ATPase n=1 Tax=Myroides sp. TSA_177.3 TaxID=3415650 RepID=UPI004045E03F